MQNNYMWLVAGIVIAVILVGGIFLASRRESPAASTTATSTAATTTTVDLGNGQSITVPAGATVTPVPNNAPTPPSLTGAIQISSSLPADAQSTLRLDEQSVIAQLEANPSRLDLWLQLGVDRKIGGDYQGAIAAWDYVASFKSNVQYVAYGDLGDLYMNFDVNYPKAEADYKAAIALSPQTVDYYTDLYTLYTSFYKQNTSAAADILAQGLKANPGNQQLLVLQAQSSH